ncbi:MAG: three-Cys-motif partner protein TcmP [Chloroflexota bacterium]
MSDEIVWKLEPHTHAKHEILRYYLGAWFPILASAPRRLLYVDGFAGPGVYKGREDGSPIIAIKVAKDHILREKLNQAGRELLFLFIEKDEKRLENLKKKILELQLPSNFKIETVCDTFESAFGRVLSEIEEQGKRLAPSFVFIDPFGPTGFPLQLIGQLAKQARSEVLINFNYQAINQWFLNVPSMHNRLDELYGSGIWRQALSIVDTSQKEDYLMNAYQSALKSLGWQGRSFRMINKHNQTQYYLFFATKSWQGMLAMKQAMWRAAPLGDFKYSDLSNKQQINMFEKTYDENYSNQLADQLYKNYRGRIVPKKEIIENYLAWHPICIGRHLTSALKNLECQCNPPKIQDVNAPNKVRRRNTYPDDCTITFAP